MDIKLDKDTNTQQDIEIVFGGQQLRLYFSYKEVIAFEINFKRFVCENVWKATTGGHLNTLEPNKKKRLPRDEFLKKLKRIEFHINF